MDEILQVMAYLSSTKLIPCFFLPFKNFQIGVPDSRLDISTNSEQKWNICERESKFGC